MHFHWDNFDSVVSRAFRSLAPPLINLLLISYIFYDGLGLLVVYIASWLPAASEAIGNTNLNEWTSPFLNLIPDLLERFFEGDFEDKFTGDLAGLGSLVLGFLGSAFTAFLSFLVAVLIAAYILDFLVRAIGFAIPVRATLNERRLVYHRSLDSVFREALEGSNKHDLSRYYLWRRAQAHAEKLGQDSNYFDVRKRLLATASTNERAFSYIAPYFLFSIISATWSGATSLGLSIFVILLGIVLLARQFSIACSIISNDLETFVAMPMDQETWKARYDDIPDGSEPDDTPNWFTSFAFFTPWVRRYWRVLIDAIRRNIIDPGT